MKRYLVALLIVLLSSCNSAPPTPAAPVTTPAEEETPLSQESPTRVPQVTATPEPTASRTHSPVPPTATSSPTSTQEPTLTPESTATLTTVPTATVFPTPAPSATQVPVATETATSQLPPGTHSLIGYYTPFERSAWGETRVCDDFVVTAGSQELIEEFIALVDAGNTVQSKNELNQPVINLDFSPLSPADVERIKASTAAQPVELIVLRPEHPGGDALVCHSFVEIVEVR